MNRRQRRRQIARRIEHAAQTRPVDRPAIVLERKSYPEVKSGHIVPRMYQHSWAVNGMVAVHESGRAGCRLRTTKKVATRPTYYRRQQPTGKQIDDIEACLAFVEDKATIPLREVVGGAEVTPEHKGALAQFLAVQMLRGPAFFERREEIVRPLLANLEAEDLRPGVLAAAGGDLEAVRSRVIAGYLGPTQKFMSMLQKAPKIAGVLGLMRWEYVSFDEPVLAYSDHPIVVWPSNARSPTKPFRGQQHGPLGAFEIRAPLSPRLAVLMTWVDLSDQRTSLSSDAAGEFNAFTIGQADQEWMHQSGEEPPVATGRFRPLARLTEKRYDFAAFDSSLRRARAFEFIEERRARTYVNEIEVLVDLSPT